MHYKNVVTVTTEEVTRQFIDIEIGKLHANLDDFSIDDTIEHMQAIQEDLTLLSSEDTVTAAKAFYRLFNSYPHYDLLPDNDDADQLIKWGKMGERYAIILELANSTVLAVVWGPRIVR